MLATGVNIEAQLSFFAIHHFYVKAVEIYTGFILGFEMFRIIIACVIN